MEWERWGSWARTRPGRAERPGVGGVPRGRTRRWLVAAVAVPPALALLPFLAAFVGMAFSGSEYPLGGVPKAVSCTPALGGDLCPELGPKGSARTPYRGA
ncbi:hypothetical protein GCM10010524_16610 [Streptomyces mexicanus]